MKLFLANENISRATVYELRRAGHDVVWIAEDSPTIKDDVILLRASAEQRIIITFDSDYGEPIFHKRLPSPLGVIYLRLNTTDETEPARLILRYLAVAPNAFDHRFCVLTSERMRFKSL